MNEKGSGKGSSKGRGERKKKKTIEEVSASKEGRKAKEQASSLSVYRADRNVENDPGNRAVITHRTTFPFIFSPLLFARLETAVGDRCCVFVLNGPRAPVPREGLVLLVLASKRLRGEREERRRRRRRVEIVGRLVVWTFVANARLQDDPVLN